MIAAAVACFVCGVSTRNLECSEECVAPMHARGEMKRNPTQRTSHSGRAPHLGLDSVPQVRYCPRRRVRLCTERAELALPLKIRSICLLGLPTSQDSCRAALTPSRRHHTRMVAVRLEDTNGLGVMSWGQRPGNGPPARTAV